MLEKELRHEPFNKAAHNRELQQVLANRTRGSVERKHQNISAVLIELGFPYIEGYKPLVNFQKSLLPEVVSQRLAGSRSLQRLVANVVNAPAQDFPLLDDLLAMEVPAPKPDPKDRPALNEDTAKRIPRVSQNFLEVEARNQSLGRAGEELVLRFEHERLWKAGQRTLADKVEHVAATKGDGLGYDILSFEADGRERLIEVKTTRFGALTPFFASRNEVNVSNDQQENFHLYRLFKFSTTPRLFTLSGSLRHTCRLDAVQFSAVPM